MAQMMLTVIVRYNNNDQFHDENVAQNDTFFALNLIMTFFRRRNKHLCMLAFVYGEW